MKALIEKLKNVQSKLKAPKSQYNSFGKYSYRNQEDILEAVKPLLAAEGLIMTISDEVIEVGTRVYVKATVSVTDGENTVSNSALARESLEQKGMNDAQITGSASSYARKYALNGMFLIDDTKDADATNTHGKEDTKTTTAKETKTTETTKTGSKFTPKGKTEQKKEEPKQESGSEDNGGWS